MLLQAKELHEKGKTLCKSGHFIEAMQNYQEVVKICARCNFKALAADTYYSIAQLHRDLEDYQIAFQQCTVSIEMRPTAKVCTYMYYCITMTVAADLCIISRGLLEYDFLVLSSVS